MDFDTGKNLWCAALYVLGIMSHATACLDKCDTYDIHDMRKCSEFSEKSHKYVLEFQIAHRTAWILWHTTRSRAAFAHRHHIQHNRISEHHPLAHVDVFGVQNLHLQIVVTRDAEASIFPEQERAHSGVIETKNAEPIRFWSGMHSNQCDVVVFSRHAVEVHKVYIKSTLP